MPFIFRKSSHRQAWEGNRTSPCQRRAKNQWSWAHGSKTGGHAGPMLCDVSALEGGPGLPPPAALPELTASRLHAGPGKALPWPCPKGAGRPWAEAALAKRVGIHAPYPESRHMCWDGCRPGHLNQAWKHGASWDWTGDHSCHRGASSRARKLATWLTGRKNLPLLSSEPAHCQSHLQNQMETASRNPDSCFETFQWAMVPSLKYSFHGTLFYRKGNWGPEQGRPLQAKGRTRTRPKQWQGFSNPTAPQDIPQRGFGGKVRTGDLPEGREQTPAPRPHEALSPNGSGGVFKGLFGEIGKLLIAK